MMCLGTIIEIEKDLWDMGQAEHLAHFSKSYFCTHIVRIVSDTEICLQSVFCYCSWYKNTNLEKMKMEHWRLFDSICCLLQSKKPRPLRGHMSY